MSHPRHASAAGRREHSNAGSRTNKDEIEHTIDFVLFLCYSKHCWPFAVDFFERPLAEHCPIMGDSDEKSGY